MIQNSDRHRILKHKYSYIIYTCNWNAKKYDTHFFIPYFELLKVRPQQIVIIFLQVKMATIKEDLATLDESLFLQNDQIHISFQ